MGDRVICGRLPDEVDLPAKSYDVVLLTDALEHIEDDVASVQTAMRLLKPAGIVVATEPAYQWLYSPRDRHHHQFRCYGKRQFAALWQHDDAETVLLSHYNTLLFPPAAVARFASKVLGSGKDAGDLAVPPRFLNSVLAAVMGSETHLLGRVPLPFGLSLVGVVRKTEINQNFVTAAA